MPDVQMDYDAVEELSRSYLISVQELQQTLSAMEKIASTLENGALVNQRGDQWVGLLRSRLTPKLQRLQDALEEVGRDLQGAVRELRERDGVDGRDLIEL